MVDIGHPALFLLFAVALWFAIGLGMAHVSGWRTLAIHYRATEPFLDKCWYFSSASIRPVTYHRCLTLGANTRGLCISPLLPFRFSHPSLFVPWSEIDEIERCRESGRPMVRFHFRRTPSVAFTISLDLARAAIGELGGRSPPPGAGALLDPDIPAGKATA